MSIAILVKGIEIPKHDDEYVIITVYGDGSVVYGPLNRNHVRYKHRAVPVPPHGDLIGREWLIDIALHLMNTAKNDDIANGVKWLLQYIIDAPTIINAKKE